LLPTKDGGRTAMRVPLIAKHDRDQLRHCEHEADERWSRSPSHVMVLGARSGACGVRLMVCWALTRVIALPYSMKTTGKQTPSAADAAVRASLIAHAGRESEITCHTPDVE
jgi:hypothetical protein